MTAVYPQVKLHLYGKREARPGRKMGHLTAVADNVNIAKRLVKEARALLVASGLYQPQATGH
jgi:5-(carboxyamino)imidazole ribonucleotide synthase